MIIKYRQACLLATALSATAILAACGGSSNSNIPSQSPPMYSYDYVPTGVDPTKIYTWDINWIDTANERYLLADRTTSGVDVYDIKNKAFLGTATGGFTGAKFNAAGATNNTISGPNGATVISGNTVYAGDVNKLFVVDSSTMKVVTSVAHGTLAAGGAAVAALGGTGLRTDEGCFDPKHNRYIIATPDVDNSVKGQTPFFTVFDTTVPTAPVVTGYISFFDPTDLTNAKGSTSAAGLEQCAYDAVNDQFLLNNDQTVANAFGEVNAFGAAAVAAISGGAIVNYTALAGYKVYGIGGSKVSCNPRGLDLGPSTEFAINCSNSVGSPMVTLIMNRSTGAIIATAAFGGGDQMMYDSATSAYYVTGSSWNSTGIRSASSLVTPLVGVVAQTTGTVTAMLQAGQGSHSLAVDPVSHLMFVPHTAATASVCPNCIGNQFATSGISVYVIK